MGHLSIVGESPPPSLVLVLARTTVCVCFFACLRLLACVCLFVFACFCLLLLTFACFCLLAFACLLAFHVDDGLAKPCSFPPCSGCYKSTKQQALGSNTQNHSAHFDPKEDGPHLNKKETNKSCRRQRKRFQDNVGWLGLCTVFPSTLIVLNSNSRTCNTVCTSNRKGRRCRYFYRL